MTNRNLNVPILPDRTPFWEGAVDEVELRRFLRGRTKKVFSLDQTQVRILTEIVFPYWQNYLKAIAHPFKVETAGIWNLRFAWADLALDDRNPTTRVAQVFMETYVSVNLCPEKILFRIQLCKHNVPRQCLIIHEGRGRFQISLRDQECDGVPH